ncbi:hypothetical protein ES703_88841 [subsurface metagenome]
MNWREFLNTPDERHAFWIGFLETLIPRRPLIKPLAPNGHPLQNEYHYYSFGRAMGLIPWLILLVAIAVFLRK